MSHVLERLLVPVGTALLVAASAGACSSSGDDGAAPSPTPSAAPTATEAEPEPVDGEVAVEVRSVSPNPVVYSGGKAPDVDRRAVQRFSADVATWLDDHLTDLQHGSADNLTDVAAKGLIESGDARLVETVTTALASPERHVATARYHFLVAADAEPEWLRATIITEDRDGEVATAQFVFVPGPGGPVLLAAGPAGRP